MDKKIPVTQETYDQLVAEWNKLKKIDRPRVVDELEEARKQGDLSENAEYHAAKEMLAKIDARIPILEEQISSAQIISFDSNSTTIKFATIEAIKEAKAIAAAEGRELIILAYVLGTDLDTPSLEQQSQMLLDAGVILASSSTNTGLLAREFICKGEEA